MSIILKGIDMPIEGELRLIISKNGMICGAEYPKVRHTYPLNLDAKAIQIPKNHGRLIDADKYQYPGDLEYEPTILESEGNDEFDIERD